MKLKHFKQIYHFSSVSLLGEEGNQGGDGQPQQSLDDEK